jgi:hypothetical protein
VIAFGPSRPRAAIRITPSWVIARTSPVEKAAAKISSCGPVARPASERSVSTKTLRWPLGETRVMRPVVLPT